MSRQLRWMRPLAWQLPQRVRALESSTCGGRGDRRARGGSARRALRSTRAPARAAIRAPARPTVARRIAACRRRAPCPSIARASLSGSSLSVKRLPSSISGSPSIQRRGGARLTCHSSSLRSTQFGVLLQQPLDRALRRVPRRADAQALFVDEDRDRAAARAALDRVAHEPAFEREVRAADGLLLPEAQRQLELAGLSAAHVARIRCISSSIHPRPAA